MRAACASATISRSGAVDNLWYVRRIFVSYGMVCGPRVVGVTHNRRGERLFFPKYDDAERAAARLNAKPVQLGMML
jgi:hypothetical protein